MGLTCSLDSCICDICISYLFKVILSLVVYSLLELSCNSFRSFFQQYMTDGMLLREFLSEPDLAGYRFVC